MAIILILFLFSLSSITADHEQSSDGRSVAFEHRTGNEWWVEVVLSGHDAASVEHVDAQHGSGDWVPLEKRDWGAWAASFHIPPGEDVRFRAGWDDGSLVTSCWFTHPEGEEQCNWHLTPISRTGENVRANAIALGDTREDGNEQVFVATNHGIQVHDLTGQGWMYVETIAPERSFSQIAVGDAADTGTDGVYAISDSNDLYRYERDGDGWAASHTPLEDFGGAGVSAIVIGDGDNDGQDEIYVGAKRDDTVVVQVRIENDVFEETVIAQLDFGTQHLTVGDGTGDGANAVYNGGGNRGIDGVERIAFDGEEWTQTRIDYGHGSSGTAGVATGDLTGEGESVYTARIGFDFDGGPGVWQSTLNGEWESEQVVAFDGDKPNHMIKADATNDGAPGLYVTSFEQGDDGNKVHRVAHEGGTWSHDTIAVLPDGGRYVIAAGDADGDGLQDLYLVQRTAEHAWIFQLTKHAPPALVDLEFDHRGSNQWWVQVRVSADTPDRVQAMPEGGSWHELHLQDWGDWAESFHVPPGSDVRFRAMVDGAWYVSCSFTHPEGRAPDGSESCGSVEGEPAPPDGFEASFRTSGGNDWWVEVWVDADEPLMGVDARVDGGDWRILEKTDWGSWARSFKVEDGSLVQFRATSEQGGTDTSGEYRWPEGEPV